MAGKNSAFRRIRGSLDTAILTGFSRWLSGRTAEKSAAIGEPASTSRKFEAVTEARAVDLYFDFAEVGLHHT
jgi:hypothetical protein